MSTVTVNISFQDSLLREIDRVAKGESRSRSELLREAARVYIERKTRWAGIFTLGRQVARARGVTPPDVAAAIAAHRRTRAKRR